MINNQYSKLSKPTFVKGIWEIVIGGLSFVFGIVPSFISKVTEIKFFGVPLNWAIFFFTILTLFITYTIVYICKVNKFNENYETQYSLFLENQDALISDNDNYAEKNKNLKCELEIRENIIFEILTFLNASSLEPNDYEKDCINNLLNYIQVKVNAFKRNGDKKW